MPSMKWQAKDIPAKCVALGGARTYWTFQGVRNLVLDCMPDGQRIWRARWRPTGAKSDRAVKLGPLGTRAGELTPGMARDRRDAVMGAVAEGRDPFAEERAKAAEPAGQTVAALFEIWLAQSGRARAADDADRFRLYVPAEYKARGHATVGRADLAALLASIAQRSPRGADLVAGALNTMWNWAIDTGAATVNPAARQPKHDKSPPRERELSAEEMRIIWREAGSRPHPQMGRLLRLAMLLGARRSEIVGARSNELQLSGAEPVWTIPAARMKAREAHVIPLPPEAVKLFAEAVAAGGDEAVFGGRDGGETVHPMAATKAFSRIVDGLGIDDATLHDCRRTLASGMAQMGVPEAIIGRVLSHAEGRQTVTGRHYNRWGYLPEKRRALTMWQNRLMAIVSGAAPPTERW